MIPNLTVLIAVYCNAPCREGTAENPRSTASRFLFVAAVFAIVAFGFLTYETTELANKSSLPLR